MFASKRTFKLDFVIFILRYPDTVLSEIDWVAGVLFVAEGLANCDASCRKPKIRCFNLLDRVVRKLACV